MQTVQSRIKLTAHLYSHASQTQLGNYLKTRFPKETIQKEVEIELGTFAGT